MFIIGERINGMFKNVAAAIKEKNKKVIQELAVKQYEAGANALDINVGPASENPSEAMRWLIETVQEAGDFVLAIDTPKIEIMEEGIKLCKNRPIINSTTAEDAKLEKLSELAKKYSAQLISLTMDEKGVPQSIDSKLELALKIISKIQELGISPSDLYIDPIILPVNVAQNQPGQVLETIRQCKILSDPPPNTILGLSNVSQKCTNRPLINRTYLAMARGAGLDAAILDPLDKDLMDTVITADLLMDKQIYCDSYLESYRRK